MKAFTKPGGVAHAYKAPTGRWQENQTGLHKTASNKIQDFRSDVTG